MFLFPAQQSSVFSDITKLFEGKLPGEREDDSLRLLSNWKMFQQDKFHSVLIPFISPPF